IYVSDLTAYNAGRLHGCWFDLDGYVSDTDGLAFDTDVDQLGADIAAWLELVPGREEYAIHDYDGPIGALASMLGEYVSLGEVLHNAAGLLAYGDAWAAWIREMVGSTDPDDCPRE